MNCAKTEEQIELPLEACTRVGLKNHALGLRFGFPKEKGQIKGECPKPKLVTTLAETIRLLQTIQQMTSDFKEVSIFQSVERR